MFLKPCHNCPHRKGCEIKAEKLAAVRGAGLTAMNFKCDRRLSQLQPGQRIEFKMVDCERDGYGDGVESTFQAIVMRPYRSKILVWLVSVDDDAYDTPGPHPQVYEHILLSNKNPIAVRPDRVRPVNGRVEVCPECGQPEGTKPEKWADGQMHFYCELCEGTAEKPEADDG